MATEKRLIRADETVDAFTKWLTSTYDCRMPVDIVNEIPTVDAVEVVRCKHCEHWDRDFDWCDKKRIHMEAEDFCSYGERKDNG